MRFSLRHFDRAVGQRPTKQREQGTIEEVLNTDNEGRSLVEELVDVIDKNAVTGLRVTGRFTS